MSRIRLVYFVFNFLLPCMTYFFHECVHWLAYRSIGINGRLTINTIVFSQELVLSSTQNAFIYGSGVLFTLFQGVMGFVITIKREATFGFNILLSAAIFRWAAILQGLISSSDEIKIGIALGMHPSIWPISISVSFFGMVYYSFRNMKFSLKTFFSNSLLFLLLTILISLL